MQKSPLFAAFVWLLTNCSGSSSTGSGAVGPDLRDTPQVTAVESRYTDTMPSVDASGTKVVFLSSRQPHADQPRLYKYSIGSDQAPELWSGVDDGALHQAQISYDGAYIAYSSYTSAGAFQLSVVAWQDQSQKLVVAEGLGSGIDFDFITSDGLKLVYMALDQGGSQTYKVLQLAVTDATLSLSSTTDLEGVDGEESQFHWSEDRTYRGLYSRRVKGFSQDLIYRPWQSDGSLGSPEVLRSWSHAGSLIFSPGSRGVVVAEKLAHTTAEITPVSDRIEVEPIYRRSQLVLIDPLTKAVSVLTDQQYAHQDVAMSYTHGAVISLGWEAFDCQSAGAVSGRFYGLSLVVHRQEGEVRKLIFKPSAAYDSVELISSDFCGAFAADTSEAEQDVDLQWKRFALVQEDLADQVAIVFQSWKLDDDEVFYLKLDIEALEVLAFERVSANTP